MPRNFMISSAVTDSQSCERDEGAESILKTVYVASKFV